MRIGAAIVLTLACNATPEASAPDGAAAAPDAKPEPAAANKVAEPRAPEQQGADAKPTCLAEWTIDQHQSVLDEQRGLEGAKDLADFPDTYPAEYLVPEDQHPVAVVERFQMGGTPLLWFSADQTHPVVNAAVLTELIAVDATSVADADDQRVGALTELGQGRMPNRDLAEWLIRSDVVRAYAHIGAELCVRAERDDAQGYRVWIDGEHEYFTNERNVGSLRFAIDIGADGTVRVLGEAAPR